MPPPEVVFFFYFFFFFFSLPDLKHVPLHRRRHPLFAALVVIFITYSILKLVPTLTRPSYTFGYFPEFANLAVQVISLGYVT